MGWQDKERQPEASGKWAQEKDTQDRLTWDNAQRWPGSHTGGPCEHFPIIVQLTDKLDMFVWDDIGAQLPSGVFAEKMHYMSYSQHTVDTSDTNELGSNAKFI